jgi:hypothetical protein
MSIRRHAGGDEGCSTAVRWALHLSAGRRVGRAGGPHPAPLPRHTPRLGLGWAAKQRELLSREPVLMTSPSD